MKECNKKLHQRLKDIEESFGGDVNFLEKLPEKALKEFEKSVNWNLPEVFRYFYTHESNGLIIDDKRIYSIYDPKQKKTWVENLARMNDPEHSPWFKGRPQIFKDYLVIGEDNGVVFCLSKKYDYENPALYICNMPNNSKGVDLENLSLDLQSLVAEMVDKAFE